MKDLNRVNNEIWMSKRFFGDKRGIEGFLLGLPHQKSKFLHLKYEL